MKYSSTLAASAILAGQALAFPAAVYEAIKADPATYENIAAAKAKRVNGISPGFDASKQFVSTTGQYQWVAPTSTDQRGVCPGLNALANHGYLPHNGVATIAQFIDATTKAVGMGPDLAAFLSIYGAVFDGDLTSWSIGGPDARVGVPLLGQPLGLVGTPNGLIGSHNKYEADYSPTRGDLYLYNNNYNLRLEQFTGFFALQASVPAAKQNFDLGVQQAWRVRRFKESVSGNPYFFNNAFSGVLVNPAAYTFQFRFMANHSSEYPAGRLSGANLKSWFGVTGKYPNFKHIPGHERIPDNWYRRAYGDEYTIPFFLEDVAGMGLQYPQFFDIGGNTNGVNTFTGIDLLNVTGGIFNTKNFADPNVLACFLYNLLLQQGMDIINPALTLSTQALNLLQQAAGQVVVDATCKKLNKKQVKNLRSAVQGYPGYAKLDSTTGTYHP